MEEKFTNLNKINSQQELNNLLKEINTVSDDKEKQGLLKLFDEVQLNYLKTMFSLAKISENGKVEIEFANDRFCDYKIVFIKNGEYTAEVTNGITYSSYIEVRLL